MSRGVRLLVACSTIFLAVNIAIGQVETQVATNSQPEAAPLVLTFQDAVARAQKNLPQFLSAKTDLGLARQDTVQARAALLPTVTYNTEYLYTEGNRTTTGVFVANNFVHEYSKPGKCT